MNIHNTEIRKLRREVIALETEVGELCARVAKLEAELKLLRKE